MMSDEVKKWVPKLDDKIKALNSSRVFKSVTPKGDLSWYVKWDCVLLYYCRNDVNIFGCFPIPNQFILSPYWCEWLVCCRNVMAR